MMSLQSGAVITLLSLIHIVVIPYFFFLFLFSVSLHHAVRHMWHQLGGNFSGFNLRA